jgi:hypothetical protein
VEPFEEQYAEVEAAPIREALAGWIAESTPALTAARPKMPDGVVDRPAEVWKALLAIADHAGAGWPDAGRDAARYFVLDTATAPTFGTRLLADLRTLFAGRDRMPTVEILHALVNADEGPWGDLAGKPLDSRKLAKELGRYGVGPASIREPTGPTKGYTTYPTTGNVGLADAWDRYLPALSGYTGYSGDIAGKPGNRTELVAGTSVTPQGLVTDVSVTPQDPVTPLSRHVTDVTDVTAPAGPHRNTHDRRTGGAHPAYTNGAAA